MIGEGCTLPPSEGRIGAAAREGVFPRSRLLAAGITLLAGAGAIWLLGEWAAGRIAHLAGEGLRAALATRVDPASYLVDSLWTGVSVLAPLAGVILIAGVVPQGIAALVQRRKGGQTSTPVPRLAGEGRASGIAALLSAAVFGLAAIEIARRQGPAMIGAEDSVGAAEAISTLVASLLAAAGGVALLGGAIQLVFERGRIWRALHLSSSQAARDLRDQAGDREVRARMNALSRGGGAR